MGLWKETRRHDYVPLAFCSGLRAHFKIINDNEDLVYNRAEKGYTIIHNANSKRLTINNHEIYVSITSEHTLQASTHSKRVDDLKIKEIAAQKDLPNALPTDQPRDSLQGISLTCAEYLRQASLSKEWLTRLAITSGDFFATSWPLFSPSVNLFWVIEKEEVPSCIAKSGVVVSLCSCHCCGWCIGFWLRGRPIHWLILVLFLYQCNHVL